MNLDVNTIKNILAVKDMLPTHVTKADLLAQIAAMEAQRAREKATHRKMFIAGAAIAATAAAAAAAYMVLSKKEITIHLNCGDQPQNADACCCIDDEPVEKKPRRTLGDVMREKAAAAEAATEACCCEEECAETEEQCCCDEDETCAVTAETGCDNCIDAGEACFSCEDAPVAPCCADEADVPCCSDEEEPKVPCNDCE